MPQHKINGNITINDNSSDYVPLKVDQNGGLVVGPITISTDDEEYKELERLKEQYENEKKHTKYENFKKIPQHERQMVEDFLKVQKLARIISNVDDVEKSTRLRELESKHNPNSFYISSNSFSIDTEVMRFGPEDPHILFF
jgi:hypothetical protein